MCSECFFLSRDIKGVIGFLGYMRQLGQHRLQGMLTVTGFQQPTTEWANQASSTSEAALSLTEGEGQFELFSLTQPGTQW